MRRLDGERARAKRAIFDPMFRSALPLAAIVLTLCTGWGCSPKVPPRWAEGGAPLSIAPARWDRGEADTVEIRANGQVLEDGDLTMVIDRVGRVTDDDYEPLAVLLPDGHLVGTDNRLLGRVGVTNASPPDRESAWLALLPNGQVMWFDEEGERATGGVWHGCQGPAQRTCTLVTHLIAVRNYVNRAHSGVHVGVGVGVGF
jgi:hypothetical protein